MQSIRELIRNKADAGELFFESSEELSLRFEGWKLKSSEINERAGYSVRVIKNGRIGFSGSTDPNAVEDIVDRALQTAKLGEKLDLEFPGPEEKREFDIYDEKVVELSYEKVVEIGKAVINELSSLKGECELRIDIRKYVVPKIFFENTQGANFEIRSTFLGVTLELMKMVEGDVIILDDSVSGTHFDDVNNEIPSMIARLKDKYASTKNIVKQRVENIPVIFSPNALFALLVPIFAATNGKNVVAGSSPLAGKLGEKIFDEKFSIIDDGTIPRKNGTVPFDDEGIPKNPIVIVEKGVLKNYYLDLVTAKKLGMKSNGAASRGIFSAPSPSRSNVIVGDGFGTEKELFNQVKRAVLLDGLLGIGQGNVLSGAFSNPVALAFLVEDGQIVGRLKNLAVAGNVYECLSNIAAISGTREWKYGTFLLPYILLDNVSITGGE